VYGPTAWWWEVEELLRKLLLTAVVVLMDVDSYLQVGRAGCDVRHPPAAPAFAPRRLLSLHLLHGSGSALFSRASVVHSCTCCLLPSAHAGAAGVVLPFHVTLLPPPAALYLLCAVQVTLAVLVSCWAHVLHAVYTPFGAGTLEYNLQHLSLFVTTFLFLVALLFKTQAVGAGTPSFDLLSSLILLLCVVFLLAWAGCMTVVLFRRLNNLRRKSSVFPLPVALASKQAADLEMALRARTQSDDEEEDAAYVNDIDDDDDVGQDGDGDGDGGAVDGSGGGGGGAGDGAAGSARPRPAEGQYEYRGLDSELSPVTSGLGSPDARDPLLLRAASRAPGVGLRSARGADRGGSASASASASSRGLGRGPSQARRGRASGASRLGAAGATPLTGRGKAGGSSNGSWGSSDSSGSDGDAATVIVGDGSDEALLQVPPPQSPLESTAVPQRQRQRQPRGDSLRGTVAASAGPGVANGGSPVPAAAQQHSPLDGSRVNGAGVGMHGGVSPAPTPPPVVHVDPLAPRQASPLHFPGHRLHLPGHLPGLSLHAPTPEPPAPGDQDPGTHVRAPPHSHAHQHLATGNSAASFSGGTPLLAAARRGHGHGRPGFGATAAATASPDAAGVALAGAGGPAGGSSGMSTPASAAAAPAPAAAAAAALPAVVLPLAGPHHGVGPDRGGGPQLLQHQHQQQQQQQQRQVEKDAGPSGRKEALDRPPPSTATTQAATGPAPADDGSGPPWAGAASPAPVAAPAPTRGGGPAAPAALRILADREVGAGAVAGPGGANSLSHLPPLGGGVVDGGTPVESAHDAGPAPLPLSRGNSGARRGLRSTRTSVQVQDEPTLPSGTPPSRPASPEAIPAEAAEAAEAVAGEGGSEAGAAPAARRHAFEDTAVLEMLEEV
jgi:hypothetical protein